MQYQAVDIQSPDRFPFPALYTAETIMKALSGLSQNAWRSSVHLGTAVSADTTLDGEPVRITIGSGLLSRLGDKNVMSRYVDISFVEVCRIVTTDSGKALERLYIDYSPRPVPDRGSTGKIAETLFSKIEKLLEGSLPRVEKLPYVETSLSHEKIFGSKGNMADTNVKNWREIINSDFSLRIIKLPSGEDLSVVVSPQGEKPGVTAAKLIRLLLDPVERPVVGFPTGNTVIPTYAALVDAYKAGWKKLDSIESFNLDEYLGFSAHNSASFQAYMKKHLHGHIALSPEHIHFPTAETSRTYSEAIAKLGGFDLCFGGISAETGHCAFNEPGSDFKSRTRVETLALPTREALLKDFGGVLDRVPERAYTVGMADILESKAVMTIAEGMGKAAILKKVLFGPVTEKYSSSILRTHPNFLLVIDQEIFDIVFGSHEAGSHQGSTV